MAFPRPQTLVIAAICVIVVGGAAWFAYSGSNSSYSKEQKNISPIAEAPIVESTDWRTAFIGTSTTQKLATKEKPGQAAQNDADLTATDKLGIDFFSKFLDLRQQGLDKDSQAVSGAVSEVISKNLSEIPAPKTYTLADITTGTSDNPTLTAYSSALNAAFASYYPAKNEADITNDAFSANDMSLLGQIDPIIANYQKLISAMQKMRVPLQLTTSHLQLLNGLSVALYNAQSLRHADTDPLRALAAIGLEMKGLEAINAAYSTIQAFLKAAGIPQN